VDIFNGTIYDGDCELWISRSLDSYPAFAREGSIVPLDAAEELSNGDGNTGALEVLIVVGADGEFELAEGDGTGSLVDDIKRSRTPIRYNQAKGTVKIGPTHGVPQKPDTCD
jgi:alpha-glucosidase (family GH31 glycosyl hydrolase)